MAMQSHIATLQRKHDAPENELHEALAHPSTDDTQIADIKRKKLVLKDEIERLNRGEDTVH